MIIDKTFNCVVLIQKSIKTLNIHPFFKSGKEIDLGIIILSKSNLIARSNSGK